MLKSLLIVGAGSFVGGALRHWVSMLIGQSMGGTFPWGTMGVNLSGCLLIGILYGVFERYGASGGGWCLLLTTGLCGGFTTFSTFSREGFLMLQGGDYGAYLAYLLVSILGGVLSVAVGWYVWSRMCGA